MANITYLNATDARKDFSTTIDRVIHNKPQFIKRTHNKIVFIEERQLNHLLSEYTIPIKCIKEEDGSYILTNSIIEDIISTGNTKEETIDNFCLDLLNYAQDYYADYELYSHALNRSNHLPYVLRILSSSSIEEIKEMLDA